MHAWPPPNHASGCVRGINALTGEPTPPLSLFHYVDERGSQWGYCTERYRTHGRQTVYHGPFSGWFWDGPSVPRLEDHKGAAFVWSFYDAPGELRALSCHGGDEDLIALFSDADAADASWVDRLHWNHPQRETLPDCRIVLIWAHA